MTPEATCTLAGPICSGVSLTPSAASTSGGPASPIAASRTAISRSHMPARFAWPAKARLGTTPIVGAQPERRANTTKVGVGPRAGSIMSCVRAPPPSSHRITGSLWRSACSNMRVIFW